MIAALLFILVLLSGLLLIALASVAPNQSRLSAFEVDRRKNTDNANRLDWLRKELFRDVLSLQRTLVALLLVIFVASAIGRFGVVIGMLLSLVIALQYASVGRFSLVRSYNQKLYNERELQLLEFMYQHRKYLAWVRSVAPEQPNYVIASKPELEHLLDSSPGVLSTDEKTLIISSLSFEQKTIQHVMTPRSVVDTISKDEILGPLVLDALHKTGHSRFPVIEGDIDHVKGVLYLRDVLTVDSSKKATAKVESAMSKRVFYIRQDHTLHQALSAFLRTHHHLFIVINEFHETVGIVTLEDTIEALLGRKIVDEFDAHDDMRAVANRQAARKPLVGTEV